MSKTIALAHHEIFERIFRVKPHFLELVPGRLTGAAKYGFQPPYGSFLFALSLPRDGFRAFLPDPRVSRGVFRAHGGSNLDYLKTDLKVLAGGLLNGVFY